MSKPVLGSVVLPFLALLVLAAASGAHRWGASMPSALEGGWRRLSEAQLQAMSAVSLQVRLGATDVVYHISPSGRDVQARYPSMSYSTRYRRKVDGPTQCYRPTDLPFTGWRCYSVWRKGGVLRERLVSGLIN